MFGIGLQCTPLWIWILSTTTLFSVFCICKGNCPENVDGCCFGFIWNYKANTCEHCMPGYTGLNCTATCPFPTYGVRCQGNCLCSKDTCDVFTGCKNLTTDQYNTYEEINVSMIANATSSTNTVSKTNQILLLFIKMIGGVDIVLLSAYVVMIIYDRQGREKTVELFLQGNSTMYENVSFSSFDIN